MIANSMQIASFHFEVKSAFFRYITDSWSGPGWDFSFHAVALDKESRAMFPYDAQLRTEGAQLALPPATDLTGIEIFAALPYNEESGEALFGLMIGEEHDVAALHLKFVERDGERYLIEITAEVSATVLGETAPLKLCAWIERQADHAYPT